ncbi:hypothetical protein K2X33_05315 [bacterium]|nr:hypothetical protein [bacterium]
MKTFLWIAIAAQTAFATAPKDYSFRELAGLFNSSTGLQASQLPESGIMQGWYRTPELLDAEAFRYGFVKAKDAAGKETIRLAVIGDTTLTDEEALAHLKGCGDRIPDAQSFLDYSTRPRSYGLRQWSMFSNLRRSTDSGYSFDTLMYILLRSRAGAAGELPTVIGRVDISDPGFMFNGQYYGSASTAGVTYWITESIKAVTPANVDSDCRKLTPKHQWYRVQPLPPVKKFPRM